MDSLADNFLRDLPQPAGPRRGISDILYVEDFDAGAHRKPPDITEGPEIIEPVFTLADLEKARATARQAGYDAACQENANVQAQLRAAALQSIADSLAAAANTASAIATARAEETAGLILAILHAALPATMAAHACMETRAVMHAILPALRREPVLRIRAHPDSIGTAGAVLQDIWPGNTEDKPRIALSPDPALRPGDIAIAWADGHALRDTNAIWNELRQALAPLGLPSLKDITDGH